MERPVSKHRFSLFALLLSVTVLLGSLPIESGAANVTKRSPVASSTPLRTASKNHQENKKEQTYSNQQILHLLNRISFGPGPGDLEAIKKMGVEAYIHEQLHPESITIPEDLKQLAQKPALSESPAKLFLTYGRKALQAIATKGSSDNEVDKKELQKVLHQTYETLYHDTADARIERAVYSPAQLQEVMTDFWYNHFNISIDKNLDHLWVGAYEETAIRPYALGKFRDLLGATAHHAAMLFYLDNWQNTSASAGVKGGRFAGINENYARELMELHTLGVDGGYTQKDVQELARVLTGLGLPPGAGGGFGQRNRAQRLAQIRGGAGNFKDFQGKPFGQFQQGGFGDQNDGFQNRGFGSQNSGFGTQNDGFQNRRFGSQNGSFGAQNGFGRQNRARLGGVGTGAGGENQMMMVQGELPAGYDINNKFGSYFDKRRHDFGDKMVVGHQIKGSGEQEIEEVLDILCKHPSTARHISFQLAQYLVSDNPPASLVDKMAKRFTETDGDIAAILDTLFHSSEFWDNKAINSKFKSPYRYLISTLRATDGQVEDIKPGLGLLSQLGQPMYKCLTPDGYKNTKDAWLNPDNLLNRLNFATAYGAGRFRGLRPDITDPSLVADCIGPSLSEKTLDAIMNSPENMKIALLLGSPEFMKY